MGGRTASQDRRLIMGMKHGKRKERKKNYSRQPLPLTDRLWRQMKTVTVSMTNTDRGRSGDKLRKRDRFNRQNL